jgi:hypothetical protein
VEILVKSHDQNVEHASSLQVDPSLINNPNKTVSKFNLPVPCREPVVDSNAAVAQPVVFQPAGRGVKPILSKRDRMEIDTELAELNAELIAAELEERRTTNAPKVEQAPAKINPQLLNREAVLVPKILPDDKPAIRGDLDTRLPGVVIRFSQDGN